MMTKSLFCNDEFFFVHVSKTFRMFKTYFFEYVTNIDLVNKKSLVWSGFDIL